MLKLFVVASRQPSLEARLRKHSRWGVGGRELTLDDFRAFWSAAVRSGAATAPAAEVAEAPRRSPFEERQASQLSDALVAAEATRIFERGAGLAQGAEARLQAPAPHGHGEWTSLLLNPSVTAVLGCRRPPSSRCCSTCRRTAGSTRPTRRPAQRALRHVIHQ